MPGPPISMASARAIRKALHRFYSFIQPVLVPGLRNSQYAYRDALFAHVTTGARWLDLGCGHRLLPEWMPGADEQQADILRRPQFVVGIDVDQPSLSKHHAIRNKVRGDNERLPFRDASFDLITANVVVEHVEAPGALLAEVRRVLRSNGLFLFHTPNCFNYATCIARLVPKHLKVKLIGFLQGRKEEDVFPTWYSMNTPSAVRALANEHGFRVRELILTDSSAQTIMLGPVVVFELLLIRILRWAPLRNLQSNIIALLERAESSE